MVDDPSQRGPMYTWPEVNLLVGVAEFLPLIAAGRTLAIGSNALDSTAADVRKALVRVGIADSFTHIFCASEMGVSKLDPAFWSKALATLGAQPQEACMIGDDLENDVLAPGRSGLMTIWFNRSIDESVTMPHFNSVRSFRELVQMYT